MPEQVIDIDSFCELSDDGKRIEVYFNFRPDAVAAIKKVPGARARYDGQQFICWTIPKDMVSARALRERFGDRMELGKAVTKWGKKERARSRNLQKLAKADDAKLKRLPKILPELAAFLRPFQRADVAFMAETSVMNANEQGLGKTVEAIAAVFEAGLDEGPQLVVAPLTSLETVWKAELDEHVGDPVYILSGDHIPDYEEIKQLLKDGEPFWFITTAAQIRRGLPAPLPNVKWKTLVVDEFHKTGLTNISGDPSKGTQFGRAVRTIIRERTFLISGTPMGGKPIKLWGALNHMKPDVFTSKWRWAEQWLEVTQDILPHNGQVVRSIGGLRPDTIDEFYPAHEEFIVRRLKSEVLPQLPAKQYIDVWCDMTKTQAKQYKSMADLAEVRIDEQRLSATGILAEYTRLKQFATGERNATAVKTSKGTKIDLPIKHSNKLMPLIERLAEIGIDRDDPSGDAVAVVASQSKVTIKWFADQLNKQGIKTELITGDTKAKERKEIVKRFQSGDPDAPRVVAVTTTAGGVAITLDRADTVHILDETWDPDDQTQLEDRVHRISRIHQVMCYYYRSKGTIEEAIYETNYDKREENVSVLDLRRALNKEKA